MILREEIFIAYASSLCTDVKQTWKPAVAKYWLMYIFWAPWMWKPYLLRSVYIYSYIYMLYYRLNGWTDLINILYSREYLSQACARCMRNCLI
jgi:hypothetical protein